MQLPLQPSMKHYFSFGHLLVFILLLGSMVMLIQLELLSFAFVKLGLPPDTGLTILFLSLLGSVINIPLMRVKHGVSQPETEPASYRGLLKVPLRAFSGNTVIAINMGGCLIPVSVSIYLFSSHSLGLAAVLLGIAIVSVISYVFSRPVQGLGIAMPILIAPISAALVGMLISPEHSAPLAYISGTLGVLIGADLLRLKDISQLGAPFASIGGAGTFDGIFITGIVAALLA